MGRTETFREVLNSLQPYPQMHFLLFSEKWGSIEETLLEFCEEADHSILLYRLEGLTEEMVPTSGRIRQRPYRIDQPRYNLQGKLYNHAFVMGTIPDRPEAFARKVYTGIANAGGLYLLMGKEEAGAWEEVLMRSNYVALSQIALDDEELLLYARKMHGWGG